MRIHTYKSQLTLIKSKEESFCYYEEFLFCVALYKELVFIEIYIKLLFLCMSCIFYSSLTFGGWSAEGTIFSEDNG
jgi:hypothetical protein